MRQSLVLYFVLAISLSAGSQNHLIDSLKTVIPQAKNDSVKAEMLNLLFSEQIRRGAHDEARATAAEVRTHVYKTGNKRFIGDYLNNIGNFYYDEGDYEKAMEYMKSSLQMSSERNNQAGIARSLSSIGMVYEAFGNYPECLEYYFKALQICEATGDKNLIVGLTNNIGNAYDYLKEFEKGMTYYEKALAIAGAQGNKYVMSTILANMGNNYYNQIAEDADKLEKLKKVMDYHLRALFIKEQINDKKGISILLANIGQDHEELGDDEKAMECYRRALEIAKEVNDRPGIAYLQQLIGNNLLNQKKADEALKFALSSLSLANEIKSLVDVQQAEELLSRIYEEKGDGINALKHYRAYRIVRDSMTNEEDTKKTVRLEMNFEFAKKEAAAKLEKEKLENSNRIQALELSRRNYIVTGLGLLLLVTLGLGWLLFRQNKLKAEQTSILLEQKLLRSQMNPHFIFNSLATIESFIYENQPKEAGRYLSDFARLMRLILENSTSEYITLEKEIKTLEHYLVLQKLRLDKGFEFKIKTDPALDPEEVMIPPMLTQPFIENAIEHGFRGSSETGIVHVSFVLSGDDLVVEVKDNGIGINKALQDREKNAQHKSRAMQITKERLAVLNRSKKQKLTFSISDISDQDQSSSGTLVRFSIPL